MTVHHKIRKNPGITLIIGLTLFDSVFLHKVIYIIKNRGLQDTGSIKQEKCFVVGKKMNNLLKYA
jgi:hypothetical protein